MSLHHSPEKPAQTPAEKLALHLESAYGLQLDPVRHAQLLAELGEHIGAAVEASHTPAVAPEEA